MSVFGSQDGGAPADAGEPNGPAAKPRSLLFACNLNSIRSPMAAGLAQVRLGPDVRIDSCGVYPGGYLDPFMVSVMSEVGYAADEHTPKTFAEVSEPFDVVVALTSLSREQAEALSSARHWRVEYWPSPDPSGGEAPTREQRLEAYRGVRNQLDRQICHRFAIKARGASTRRR